VKKGTAISFCSPEEKDRLTAIQTFLDKPIETLSIGKKEYDYTISLSDKEESIQELIREQEDWEKKRKKPNKK